MNNKKLTQLEIDNIIDESINILIIIKLFKLNIINEIEFNKLKNIIKSFY